jgi:hypothetical protein
MSSVIDDRRKYDRRTGAAFLSLIAATNVIPWMELLLGRTTTSEPIDPSEIRIAAGTCILALLLLLAAWLSGRRTSIPARPWIRNPRTAGLRFTIAAAGGNLLLAGLIRGIGSHSLRGMPVDLPVFAAVWNLVIIPLQVVAGFSLGRAGRMPGRRKGGSPDRPV